MHPLGHQPHLLDVEKTSTIVFVTHSGTLYSGAEYIAQITVKLLGDEHLFLFWLWEGHHLPCSYAVLRRVSNFVQTLGIEGRFMTITNNTDNRTHFLKPTIVLLHQHTIPLVRYSDTVSVATSNLKVDECVEIRSVSLPCFREIPIQRSGLRLTMSHNQC